VRLALVLGAATALALLLAGGAATKEGARARLTTLLSRDAAPGATVRIGWTVTIPDGNGGRQPFGAGGMFVRFLTKTGAPVPPAFGRELEVGRYAAEATVPPGGIGGIRMGLRGTNDYGTADMPIPLENDPFLSKSGVHCDVGAVSAALHTFKGAFNTGDLPGLDALFAKKTRFVWFSSAGAGARTNAAAKNRATLVAYFRARHLRGDRVISFRLRFSSFESERVLGHFSLSGRRRAADFRGGKPFAFAGKGALDCAARRARIAALSISTIN
jgi:hypothetical protein